MKLCHITLCSRMEHLEANERSLSLVEVTVPSWSRLSLQQKQQESTAAYQAGCAYSQLF